MSENGNMSTEAVSNDATNIGTSSSTNAATRADARRRRILANSAARLALIAGHKTDLSDSSAPPAPPAPLDQTETSRPPPPDDTSTYRRSPAPNVDVTDDASVFNNFRELQPDPSIAEDIPIEMTDIQYPTFLETLIIINTIITKARIHIMLLGWSVEIFKLPMFHLKQQYFFAPLLTWELTEFYFLTPEQERGTFDLAISMIGLTGKNAAYAIKICGIVKYVVRDIFMYIFSAVLFRLLLLVLK